MVATLTTNIAANVAIGNENLQMSSTYGKQEREIDKSRLSSQKIPTHNGSVAPQPKLIFLSLEIPIGTLQLKNTKIYLYAFSDNGTLQLRAEKVIKSGIHLLTLDIKYSEELDQLGESKEIFSVDLSKEFKKNRVTLSSTTIVEIYEKGKVWGIEDREKKQFFGVRKDGNTLDVYTSDYIEVLVKQYLAKTLILLSDTDELRLENKRLPKEIPEARHCNLRLIITVTSDEDKADFEILRPDDNKHVKNVRLDLLFQELKTQFPSSKYMLYPFKAPHVLFKNTLRGFIYDSNNQLDWNGTIIIASDGIPMEVSMLEKKGLYLLVDLKNYGTPKRAILVDELAPNKRGYREVGKYFFNESTIK
jgi:hypothetical protein